MKNDPHLPLVNKYPGCAVVDAWMEKTSKFHLHWQLAAVEIGEILFHLLRFAHNC